jgi:hypothetical protein
MSQLRPQPGADSKPAPIDNGVVVESGPHHINEIKSDPPDDIAGVDPGPNPIKETENVPLNDQRSSTNFIPFRAAENDTSHYRALDPTRKEIRVVTLKQSCSKDDDSPVECSLGYTSLEDPHRQQYEALSYVWGNPLDTVPITLLHSNNLDPTGDSSTSQQFNVTRNLYTALRNLRSSQVSRTLWIDALCINQSDPFERHDQVGFMAHIYSNSEHVLVWLGEEDACSRILCLSMNECNRSNLHWPGWDLGRGQFASQNYISTTLDVKDKTETTINMRKLLEGKDEMQTNRENKGTEIRERKEYMQHQNTLSNIEKFLMDTEKTPQSSFLEDLPTSLLNGIVLAKNSFFQRPWFYRTWVIQEILCEPRYMTGKRTTTQPKAFLCIGELEVNWTTFFTFCNCFEKGFKKRDKLDGSNIMKSSQRYIGIDIYLFWSRLPRLVNLDIYRLLTLTIPFQACDPRDRLYSLLGICKDTKASNSQLIRPDYIKPLVDVCIDFAEWHIKTTRTLQIILIAPFTPVVGLPSWAFHLPLEQGPHLEMSMHHYSVSQKYLQDSNDEGGTCSAEHDHSVPRLEITIRGPSLLVPGTRISRIQVVKERQIRCHSAESRLVICTATDDTDRGEELFDWLLRTYWDPKREPSDAKFLHCCLRMFRAVEDGPCREVWTVGFIQYLEHNDVSKRLHDQKFLSTLRQGAIPKDDSLDDFLGCIRPFYFQYGFFTTESGELGLGWAPEEGDLVVALKWAKFPHVLQPCTASDSEGKFENAGACLFYDQQPMNHEMYLPTEERPFELFEII